MMTSRLAALLAVGTLWLAGTQAQALSFPREPLDDAIVLLETDPVAAVALLETLSADGDVEAKATLAMALGSDLAGIESDPERSERLWSEALAGGSQNARLNIGTRQLLNDDPADDAAAFAMLQGLDTQFARPSAYPLGRAYLFGYGVEQDLAQGSRLMKAAVVADPDNIDAQFLLGRAYLNGWGIPANSASAFRHLKIAADAGDPRAQWNVGMMLLSGDGVGADEPLAYRYVRQAGEQNHEEGMISLAVMLALGQGVAINASEARTWYDRASRQGSAHALRALGMMLLVGEGGPSDPITGAAYVEMSAAAGDSIATSALQRYADLLARQPRTSVDAVKAKWSREHGPLH